MEVMLYLLPLALVLGFVGLLGFMWTLKSGQYDDLDGSAWRAIMDDDEDLIPHKRPSTKKEFPQDSVNKSDENG